MVNREVYLPDDCWVKIIDKLSSFCAVFLISKQHLSICNRLVKHLHIPKSFTHDIRILLRRFNQVKRIVISDPISTVRLNNFLHRIACSGLDLEQLEVLGAYDGELPLEGFKKLGSHTKNLKLLRYKIGPYLTPTQLISVVNCFPELQKFDSWDRVRCDCRKKGCSHDDETGALAAKFKQLRILELHSDSFVTDKGLIALSKNCVFLTEVCITHCGTVTAQGIEFLLRNSRNLASLSLGRMKTNNFEEAISCAKFLTDLRFASMIVSDDLLRSIAKANIILKKFYLEQCQGFTYSGLLELLQTHRSIANFSLWGAGFLTDSWLSSLLSCLTNLNYLKISVHKNFLDSTLLKVIANCHFLEEIEVLGSGFRSGGVETSRTTELGKNYKIRKLMLWDLNDENLKKFGTVCPRVEELELRMCPKISDVLEDISNRFSKLKHMKVDKTIRLRRPFSQVSRLNLEVLDISHTEIDDKTLEAVAARCPHLVKLNLKSCTEVTAAGVAKVLDKCDKLKEIYVDGCRSAVS